MRPLHPVDRLEVLQIHATIQHLEFRTQLVPRELRFPRLLVARGEGARHGSPFGDAEPGFGEAGQAAEDDDAEDARCGGEQPVCCALGRDVWEGGSGARGLCGGGG